MKVEEIKALIAKGMFQDVDPSKKYLMVTGEALTVDQCFQLQEYIKVVHNLNILVLPFCEVRLFEIEL